MNTLTLTSNNPQTEELPASYDLEAEIAELPARQRTAIRWFAGQRLWDREAGAYRCMETVDDIERYVRYRLRDSNIRSASLKDLAYFRRCVRALGQDMDDPTTIRTRQLARAETSARRETSTPAQRLAEQLVSRYSAEILRRGGETEIHSDRETSELQLIDRDCHQGLNLLSVSGWRYYSRQFGSRHTTITYLCGTDDSGDWAVRVPGTIDSVAEAIVWITPSEVQKAQAGGRRVLRQGDVYAIEMHRDRARESAWEVADNHSWNPETRTLTHPEHAPLAVPFEAKFVRQRALEMGRSGRWGYGD